MMLNRGQRILLLLPALTLVGSGTLAADQAQGISPGAATQSLATASSCPAFSWSGTADALGYELAVYRLAGDESLSPIAQLELLGDARSWTPPASACPQPGGRYAWTVRKLTDEGPGGWSELLLFETPGTPTEDEVRRALETLKRYRTTDVGAGLVGEGLAPSRGSVETAVVSLETREDARSSPTALDAEALTVSTLGAGPSPAVIAAPASFSLNLTADLNLGGSLFKDGLPFVHTDEDPARRNSAVGINALTQVAPIPGYEDITGIDNTAVGYQALRENTFARHNTAVGAYALAETLGGSENTAVGSGALALNTGGSLNVAVGRLALSSNQVGSSNVAVGDEALASNTAGANVAVGPLALRDNIDGVQNVAVGFQALNENDSGQGNAALGAFAMRDNLTGSFSTAVGFGAGGSWETGHNNIAIGRGAYGMANESGVIRIGGDDHQTQTFIEGISGTPLSGLAVVIDGDQLGVTASSARFKHDIRNLEGVSDRLLDLQPVSFRYNEDGRATGAVERLEYGLIAEEVAKVFPELVVDGADGKPFTVRYQLLTPLLLAEVQRLDEELQRQRQQTDRLREIEKELAALRRQLDRQKRTAERRDCER